MSSMLLACGVDKPENEERYAHISIYWRATCGFVSDKIFSVCHSDFVSTRKFTGDGKMKWLVNADKQYITFTSCTLYMGFSWHTVLCQCVTVSPRCVTYI